jgi:hypothetical protein
MITEIKSSGQRFIPLDKQGKCPIEVQGKCSTEGCEDPHTNSCTDSILVNGERKESAFRHGCDKHPVQSMREQADGSSITWRAYLAQ